VDHESIVLQSTLGFRNEGLGLVADFRLSDSGVIVASCVFDFPTRFNFRLSAEHLGRIADTCCQGELGFTDRSEVWDLVSEYAT
jgi:hypothetical protein